MKFIRRHLKVISAFLFINTLNYICFPMVSMALTSGPATPEAFSFEPFDTSDMVNLQTGDFTYNIPLLEVPGPAGSYPISLAYHAGIRPDQEASWVGLGWNVNPGSISRYVNNYPDDWDGLTNTVRDFWKGGESEYTSFGVSFGIGKMASASAGITVASDSYKGTGVGVFGGVGIGAGNATFGINGGYSPYGGVSSSSSVGLSGGIKSGNTGMDSYLGMIGLRINSTATSSGNTRTSLGLGLNSSSGKRMLGYSISNDSRSGTSSSLSVGGANTSQSNSKAGKISTYENGFSLTTPPVHGVSINLSRSYVRYWSDETSSTTVHGSLYNYPASGTVELESYNDQAYDIFDVGDYDQSFNDDFQKELTNKGTFIDYDNYQVSGQGIRGSIRPYYFQASLNRQNIYNEEDDIYDVKNIHSPTNPFGNQRPGFRFEDDFSNKLTQGAPVSKSFPTPSHGEDFKSTDAFYKQDLSEENTYGLIVPGSRNVRYLTNSEYYDGLGNNPGFLNTNSSGFTRHNNSQIGGFRVTNATGVTYHYSLPVYSDDEHIYSENIDKEKKFDGEDISGGHAFNHLAKEGKYAYTWLLTAVTGPDFVDRGTVGVLDESDWGYWVEFDYGKWTDKYRWRTPLEGYNQDLDNNFQTFSKGKKEIYYLDKIKTKTHTALFIKELRRDAKGVVAPFDEAVDGTSDSEIKVDEGGTTPIIESSYKDYPIPQLRLNRIQLFQNEDLSNASFQSKSYGDPMFLKVLTNYTVPVYEDNVIDVDDLSGSIDDRVFRSIDFSYSYDLMPRTPNSIHNQNLYRNSPSIKLDGKLTLTKIQFNGRGGASIIPPTSFEYEVEQPIQENVLIYNAGGEEYKFTFDLGNASKFKVGDVFKTEGGYSFAIKEVDGTDLLGTHIGLKDFGFPHSYVYDGLVTETKNPAYDSDAIDMWGYLKSDFVNTHNNNLDKVTTDVSSVGVDAWSLRKIVSPMGSEIMIDYESDTYNGAVYGDSYPLFVTNCTYDGDNKKLHGGMRFDPLEYVHLASKPDVPIKIIHKFDREKWDKTGGDGEPDPPPVFGKYAELIEIDPPISQYLGNGNISFDLSNFSPSILSILEDDYTKILQVNIKADYRTEKPGGGLRVKKISLVDPNSQITESTHYFYNNYTGYTEGSLTSGVTSYEPHSMDPVFRGLSESDQVKVSRLHIDDSFKEILEYSRFVPGPGVNYEYVTIRESVEKNGVETFIPNKSRYNFLVFDPRLIDIKEPINKLSTTSGSVDGEPYDSYEYKHILVRNLSAFTGVLKRVDLFDVYDNLLSTTQNKYLTDVSDGFIDSYLSELKGRIKQQGLIEETTFNMRVVKNSENDEYRLLVSGTELMNIPAVNTGYTTKNYNKGNSLSSDILAFDQFSGNPRRTVTSTNGKKYLEEVIPAYQILGTPPSSGRVIWPETNAYPDMSPGRKNMLTQEGATFVFKLQDAYNPEVDFDPSDNISGLVNASFQSWSDLLPVLEGPSTIASSTEQDNIFRKESAYKFIGTSSTSPNPDGTYPIGYNVITNIVLDQNTTNAPDLTQGWQKASGITLYDINSHPLEAEDINGNYAATKFRANKRVAGTVANAQYKEFYLDQDFSITNGMPSGLYTHAGPRAALLGSNGKLSIDLSNELSLNKKYRLSYWVKADDISVVKPFITIASHVTLHPEEEFGDTRSVTINGNTWYLQEMIFTPPTNKSTLEIGCQVGSSPSNPVFVDNIRLMPLEASCTTYEYNSWGELSHILDNNNLFTRYEYDAMGRLKRVSKETFEHGVVKVSENEIVYRQN